jgi:hypothetical protein
MSQRVKWIEHNGKKIVFLDYSGFQYQDKEEFMRVLDEAKRFIFKAGKELLILVDVTNSYGDNEVIGKMKQDGKDEKHLVHKQAVVGITVFKELFLRTINLFTNIGIKPFNNIENAKEWLAE